MDMAPHGFDPLGIVVVAVGAIATALTFAIAIRAFVAPGETRSDHPKLLVLREDR
ncbi:MAG: hypothetical protein ACREM6_16545 [Vulcanimicrobiaceae bacterium]